MERGFPKAHSLSLPTQLSLTESDLSFSPYTPEGVFTVPAFLPAMIQSLFFFEAETLAKLLWQPSGHAATF